MSSTEKKQAAATEEKKKAAPAKAQGAAQSAAQGAADQAATQKLVRDAEKERLSREREAAATDENRSTHVFVFCNSAHPRAFTLGGNVTDKKVTIQGQWKLSDFGDSPLEVYDMSRNKPIAGGKYGVTRVPRKDWADVQQLYGQMPEFRNGLIFAADSLEEGNNRARALGHKRHGLEASPKEVPGGTEEFSPKDKKDR